MVVKKGAYRVKRYKKLVLAISVIGLCHISNPILSPVEPVYAKTSQRAIKQAKAKVNATKKRLTSQKKYLAKTKKAHAQATKDLQKAKQEQAKLQSIYNKEKVNIQKKANEGIPQAKAVYDKALAKYNEGSAGFFKYMESNGEAEATRAIQVVNEKSTSMQSDPTIELYKLINPKDKNNPTNLDNMKKAIDELNKVNEYRAKENKGLKDLKVNSYLMAVSQAQLCYSKDVIGHSQSYNVGENVAWWYKNPFDGWYDEEKAEYKKGETDPFKIGHYLNIIDDTYNTTGYSYTPKGKDYPNVYGQVFSRAEDGYTVKEYQKLFNNYYNPVVKDKTTSEKKYKDLLNRKSHPEKYISKTTNTKLANAKKKTAKAQSKLNQINKKYKKEKATVNKTQKTYNTLVKKLKKMQRK